MARLFEFNFKVVCLVLLYCCLVCQIWFPLELGQRGRGGGGEGGGRGGGGGYSFVGYLSRFSNHWPRILNKPFETEPRPFLLQFESPPTLWRLLACSLRCWDISRKPPEGGGERGSYCLGDFFLEMRRVTHWGCERLILF